MNLTHVHHVALICGDLEKTRDFYVNKLGFQIIRENARPDRNDVKLDLALDGLELEIFVKPGSPARPNYPEAKGLRHLAFRVDSVDDTVKELNALGIETEPVRTDTYTGKKMTFFFDPDGLPLELHE